MNYKEHNQFSVNIDSQEYFLRFTRKGLVCQYNNSLENKRLLFNISYDKFDEGIYHLYKENNHLHKSIIQEIVKTIFVEREYKRHECIKEFLNKITNTVFYISSTYELLVVNDRRSIRPAIRKILEKKKI